MILPSKVDDGEDKTMAGRKMREKRKGLERNSENREVRVEQNSRTEDAEGNRCSQSSLLAADCTPSCEKGRLDQVEEKEKGKRPKFEVE